jgi:GTP pyrophosphokinase
VKEGGPSRDWPTRARLPVSSRARAVRQWFGAGLEADIATGRALIETSSSASFSDKRAPPLEDVAREAGLEARRFFAALAHGDLNTRQMRRSGGGELSKPEDEDVVVARQSKATGSGSGILIVGVDKLMTGLGKCCKPAPPDPIIGFVTRGKGITIHRKNCPNIARMMESSPERMITADWGAPREEVFPVDIEVEAIDRQGLLRDISEVFSREKINVTAVNTLSKNMQARMSSPSRWLARPAETRAATRRGCERRDAGRPALLKPLDRRRAATAAQALLLVDLFRAPPALPPPASPRRALHRPRPPAARQSGRARRRTR